MLCQDDGDVGPVREIDTMTFDEHTSRQRHGHTTAACSAAHSQTEMTNGVVSEGTLHIFVSHKHSLRLVS